MQCQQCFDTYCWDGVSVPDELTVVVDPFWFLIQRFLLIHGCNLAHITWMVRSLLEPMSRVETQEEMELLDGFFTGEYSA